jgi:hypothetical protein
VVILSENKVIVVITLWILIASFPGWSQSSVLSSGNWYKFSVPADGVYKIDYTLLRNSGINPDLINPKEIKIFTGLPGMLPQANNKAVNGNLQEIPIHVFGEEDERFHAGDYILFFAFGPDKVEFDPRRQIFKYENNLFTDKNFFFLTVGPGNGRRIVDAVNEPGSFPIVQTFNDYAFYETEKYNILKSGRQWFGEQFDAVTEATIRFEIPGMAENSDIRFVSHVMAQSIANVSFQVFINNVPVLTQPVQAIPNTSYGVRGYVKADTIFINTNTVAASGRTNQDIKYQFTKGGSGLSVGYLDFFLLSFHRKLALYGDQTLFRSWASTSNAISTFQVASATTGTRIWNITNPFEVKNQRTTVSGSALTFSTATSTLQLFVAFNPDKAKPASFESKIENQNLAGITAPTLLIISPPAFLAEAQRLATHRQTHAGITARVVTTDQIYHEYSSGKQDVTAIRNFIRHLYRQPSSALKNVLLFGRGSYDYKNRVLNNTNRVPIYESRNSLSPLETYASDDYFGFLEDDEGEWPESPAQNHTLDVGIGRLPLKNIAEARQVVDKLIEYDLTMTEAGAWQNRFLFVADDGDFNIHQNQADQLANSIELYYPAFSAKKFYLDLFEQLQKPTGQFSPAAQKALDLEIRRGAAVVNFTGHGSEQVWMDERILEEKIIQNWKQGPKYPLFVTATCEFGRHDDPLQISGGERTLLQYKGGSIGLVTTARPVSANTNFTLNKAFYQAFFEKENQKFRDIGSVFRDTKNNSLSGVANRNFSLLADPSMRLAVADYKIIFDEIKTSEGSSELKALSKIVVKGHIEKDNTLHSGFTGNMIFTLFDGVQNHVTRGDENPPFYFDERSNILYQGRANVLQGQFQLEFILTKNISSGPVIAKASAFAWSKNEYAAGAAFNSNLGGTNAFAPADITPPTIRLFLGDTTFINGGTVGPSTRLIARLSDENGINVSSLSPEHTIRVQVDDSELYGLNEYYEADAGTYKKGALSFPLYDLSKGKHTLTLTASDTYNNRTSSSIDFIVTDGDRLVITEFVNYPNPFYESTVLEFTHSRPGEDLEAELSIYDVSGKKLLNQMYSVPASQFRVNLTQWEGRATDGTKLGPGIYISKLSVRSLTDGSKNDRFTKLILVN